ncbi:hypothetical protein FEQ05_02247 [Burkholderia pseudomultivorans]|uniref:DUF1772 domain-containing protein n=2 Tax=Burkholderia pseudomultivorans TaxID=1207504 RepID=A0ABU2E443_9BURK|nr:anthrone oxygenase family protein [Burkholderia pseudomultivorans]MDR8728136.1 hypothetical protein [Burkholderia pseudomultivorans]MDR8737160.1 hypothetical protein [Burkholderia pseudomultivorans]MDR8740285.1 hypothetical protein [Burkholderia pseudomultivorans]MDR8754631.1 hypothetical protein [Burkholderia pseudomultivorans]MDR8776699.1 hypothetical protein [Burkholderia pseudomultivorans]
MTMIALATSGLLWGSAIGCGLMAGVYFAFSTFVMTSLARIAPAAGVAAMNAINVEIVRSPFMPLFLGTTLSALALAVIALVGRAQPGAMAIVVGAALYVLGMFAVTMAVNVPLNDALASADPATTQLLAGRCSIVPGSTRPVATPRRFARRGGARYVDVPVDALVSSGARRTSAISSGFA